MPRRFPSSTFYFEPANNTLQFLNFDLPALIDVQVVGVNRVHYRKVQRGRDFGLETELLAGIDPGETVVANPRDELPDRTGVQLVALPTK